MAALPRLRLPGSPARLLRHILPLLLAAAAACDGSTEIRYGEQTAPQHSIAYLKSLCTGPRTPLTRDIAVRGRVVGNDRFGEFERMLVIEDSSGGISVAADIGESALEYYFGLEVEIRCNGLVLCNYGGKIMLGGDAGAYGAEPIPSRRVPLHIRPAGRQPSAAPLPRLCTFGEISFSDVDTYVRVEEVRFARIVSWCGTDPETHRTHTTEHTLIDAAGRTFTLRTAPTCCYAREPVPSGTGSLGCIVDCFDGRLSLRVTNYETIFLNAEAPPTAYP